ncbi:YHS domain-containing protein [Desulfosediminicola flagellatus]|uniref:YHS domain-containing protein n=1 Tax=Desulfosediminicola flagellatus TaxID=2569541 RepID=UPI0010AD0B5F|nr:YHS domain-containing protein [Desulfosediminicola flagellatus]
MSPLRIVVIAVLLYLAYRMITGGRKDKKPEENTNSDSRSELPVEDILMEDPICNSLVPKQQAIHLQHDGSTVYFCSEECCNKFIAQQGENR